MSCIGLIISLNPIVFSRLTCAYLACKVDEFNVSSTQFVANLVQESPAGQERVAEQILEYELLLIQQLNFHLVVHNPYRPMEGLLIDLKVGGVLQSVDRGVCTQRFLCSTLLHSCFFVFFMIYPQTRFPTMENPESLRKSADDFMTQASLTDAGLLFPPSQIALTAILNSASRAGLSMER